MAFLTILWAIMKWIIIIGGCFALIVFAIAVFHPIYFTLSGRASIKAQRGEFKLSYLFNIIKIRCVASAHTQDLWLEVFGIKKLIQRETRVKDKKACETSLEKEETAEDAKESLAAESLIADSLNEKEIEKQAVSEIDDEIQAESVLANENVAEISENSKVLESKEKAEEEKVSEPEQFTAESREITENKNEILPESRADFEEDSRDENTDFKSEDIYAEPEYKVEATAEQLAQLQSILEAEDKAKQEQDREKDDWQKKFRRFKKDFNRRYGELRGKFRIIRQKWNTLLPVAKRFWSRGKRGFKFHDARVRVKYSLDEHYLTGMLCGYIAPTIGFAKQFGISWEPIPVFPEKPAVGVYSKGSLRIDIRPYMLLWAIIGLFFERNLYKEIYWLYKRKKDKRS